MFCVDSLPDTAGRRSVLQIALLSECYDTVRALVEAGADLDMLQVFSSPDETDSGLMMETAVGWALRTESLAALDGLRFLGADLRLARRTTVSGRVEEGDVATVDMAALQDAYGRGSLKVVKHLVEEVGFDANGCCLLHNIGAFESTRHLLMLGSSAIQVFELLLKHGYDIFQLEKEYEAFAPLASNNPDKMTMARNPFRNRSHARRSSADSLCHQQALVDNAPGIISISATESAGDSIES